MIKKKLKYTIKFVFRRRVFVIMSLLAQILLLIAGLSMGGMESIHIGIKMPETFGYIGAFSAAPALPLKPEEMTLPDEYKDKTFIMICCGTSDGIALEPSKSYNKSLVDNGVTTTFYTIEGGQHDFKVWKNGLYNFAKRIF